MTRLPSGTEVTTQVERLVGGRSVPAGAVGRVVGGDGEQYDVLLIGVGTGRYAQGELVPRRAGQARFAVRRETAWAALRPGVVLEAIVGSHAWGLANERSDTDVRGVFVLPFSWTVGLEAPPEDLTSADGSIGFWEIGKAIRQALRADPNTLELLFVSSVRPLDPIGADLLAERDAFVSAEIYKSFGRYALSQLKKLHQSQRLAAHRELVFEWLHAEPGATLDAVGARLAAAAGVSEAAGKEHVKQLYASLYDQGLLAERSFAALAALVGPGAPPLEPARELRPKNAYNLLRLLHTAIGWLREGSPRLVVEGAFRDELLAVKRGDVALAEVVRRAEEMTPELEAARHATRLPPRGDVARADALLRRIRTEAARRFIAAEPGPLGRDAPPPPIPTWEDPE